MNYPDKLLVISPHIRTVSMPFRPRSHRRTAVFLEAFAALQVTKDREGFYNFRESYVHDAVGNQSVELLVQLCTMMDDRQPAVAAFRLGDLAASLVQIPEGVDDVRGKLALSHMRDALMRHPIDAALLDKEGGMPTLQRAALANDLMAEWDQPGAAYNPQRLRRQLTARAQAMWVAIAKDRLTGDELWRAMQDFNVCKEAQLLA